MTLSTPKIRDIGGRPPQALWGLAQSWRSTKGERAAGAVRQQLARLCPRDPLVGRLPAHARLPGDGGHALAGADELDEPLSPAGREP